MLVENCFVRYGKKKVNEECQIGKKIINVPEGINIDIKESLFTASKGNNKL